MSPVAPAPLPDVPPLRRLIPQLVLGLVAFGIGVAALGHFLRDPITTVSMSLTAATGWFGLMFSFALIDLVPVLTHSAVLLVGHAGGLPFWTSFFAASAGAFLGVVVSWSVGRLFGQSERLQYLLHKSRVGPLLARYGIAAVAVASVTPFPDSLCVMGTGAVKAPLWYPLVGATVRVPKIFLYLWIIEAGWGAAA